MKRLVVCSDGTWNRPDQVDRGQRSPSNVVKIARAVAPVDAEGNAQVVFYDRGVGTGNFLDRLTGGAFGAGLSANLRDTYRFLVHNFVPGDEIYLFGFSRGAFTARSTGGLIRNCGLLRKSQAHRIGEAYDMYRSPTMAPSSNQAVTFRARYSHETPIRFVGVWDTVGALGVPISLLRWFTRRRYQFHDMELSRFVEHAYHGLAIDERRKSFHPSLWQTKPSADQKVEQAWFAGVHTNVGGGYRDSGLSDIALLWMVEKAKGAGLFFDEDYLQALSRPNAGGELRDSRRGLFKLLGSLLRPIGQQAQGQESVHKSALERHRLDPSYRPVNLEDHLGT